MSDIETAAKDAPAPGPGALALLRPIVLSSLWRFRWLLALGVALGIGGGVFAGLIVPNQFKSMGKLHVRPGVREALAPDIVLSGGVLTSRAGSGREAVQNMMQALSAPEYFQRVVRKAGLDVVMAPYDPARDGGESGLHKQVFHAFQSWWFSGGSGVKAMPASGDFEHIASLVLSRSLWIVPESGASVIAFHYISHTPELAKQVVDAALEVAQEWHKKVFEPSQESLPSELAEMRLDVARADKAFSDLRKENGVTDYDTEQKRLDAYVDELRKSLNTLEVEIKGLDAAVAAQTAHLAGIAPTYVPPGSKSWVDNPEYVALAASRNKLRDDMMADALREGSADEKRTRRARFDEQIRSVEQRLESIPPKVQTPPVEETNPAYVRVAELVADLQATLRSKQAERAETEAQLNALRERLADLESIRPRLRELEEDYRQKRAAADSLASTVGNLRAVERLEARNVTSVSVVHDGTLDGIKIAPRRGMLVAVGSVLGLGAAMALVVALALFDRRVRHREDLLRLGLADDGVLVSGGGGSGMPWMLPSSLAEVRDDIARFWAALPYDRRQSHGLRIGFVPCGEGASAGRAAAALALGLAAHAGEKVCYVSTLEGPTWLGQRLGLDHQCGWSEVLRGEFALEDAAVATPVQGLHYLPAGKIGPVVPHPMAGPAFVALLDRLTQTHRFVVVELPDLSLRPEGRAVLGVMDGAQLVVCRTLGSKASVRESIAAVETAGARLLGGVLQQPAIVPPPGRPIA